MERGRQNNVDWKFGKRSPECCCYNFCSIHNSLFSAAAGLTVSSRMSSLRRAACSSGFLFLSQLKGSRLVVESSATLRMFVIGRVDKMDDILDFKSWRSSCRARLNEKIYLFLFYPSLNRLLYMDVWCILPSAVVLSWCPVLIKHT